MRGGLIGISVMLLLTAVACTNRKKVPSDIIQPDAMADLLWDVMTIKEYAYEVLPADTLRNQNIKKERSILYQQVFQLHKTNRDAFLKSFSFYTGRPDLIKIMFDTLSARGNREREESYKSR